MVGVVSVTVTNVMEVEIHANLTMTPHKEVPKTDPYVELLTRCRKNDRRAQQLVYQMVHGKMLALCLRYFQNRDDALAVMNRGMLKVFNNLKSFQEGSDFEGWVYRIVQRTAIDELRKQLRRQKHETTPEEINEHVEYPSIISTLQAKDILDLTSKLPKASNAVFHLYVVDGYNHSEIAEMLGISTGTSKWHLSNARKTLKNLIEELEL